MNRSTIDWLCFPKGRIWNPIVGCDNDCSYCGARENAPRISTCELCRSFTPHLHLEKLRDEDLHKESGLIIYADSISDWFSPGVDPEWVSQCLRLMYETDHSYIILTKYVDRINLDTLTLWPDNVHLSTSIESGQYMYRWHALQGILERCYRTDIHTILCIEPFIGTFSWKEVFYNSMPEWIIAGPLSHGSRHVKPPYMDQVDSLRDLCELRGVPLFERRGLHDGPLTQEYPNWISKGE